MEVWVRMIDEKGVGNPLGINPHIPPYSYVAGNE